MVGAETVRVESYGPMEATGVLVTRSARVPADVGLLKAPDNRVIVLTPSPDAELPPCNAQVTYLRAPLEEGVRRLRTEHGIASVDCEGGPQLFGDLLRAGLVDELHLTLVPILLGDGVRLFEQLSMEDVELERTGVINSSAVTHLQFRVIPRLPFDEE
jgi:riboflavin biosynthesis pyrimidine reductase